MDVISTSISALALVVSVFALVQSQRFQDLENKFKKLAEGDIKARQAPRIQVTDEKIAYRRPGLDGHPAPPEEQIAVRYSAVLQNKGSEVAQIKSVTLEARPIDASGQEISYGLGALVVGSLYLAVDERLSIEREIDTNFLRFVRDFFNLQDASLTVRVIFTYSGYAGKEITHKTGLLKINGVNRLQSHSNWKIPLRKARSYPLKEADS